MKTLTVIKPYSDNTLNYNETTEQYELTSSYCKDAYDHTFKNDEILQRRIEKNSDKIYDFIFSRVCTANNRVVRKIINETREGREFVRKLLSYQMEADTQTAYNDLTQQPAVNVANGQVIPREELLRNQVTVDVEQLLNNNARYLGINIWYSAPFPPQTLFYFSSRK